MKQREPDFLVLEYVTITKDPRSGLIVALGGTERAADILQRTGGFLDAPGPRGGYHRLPHGLPVEQQRLKATAAAHALLAAGHSVHLDPALNALATPDSERETALCYLAQLSERASRAESSTEIAEVLTEIAGPAEGLLPLTREAVVSAWISWSHHLDAVGEDPEPVSQLGKTADVLSRAAHHILLARNHAARTLEASAPTTLPPSPARQPSAPTSHRR
ncbi:hypothetical protein A6A06_01570 [Streptomyces sp. CB02923]|uniref:hypothetical protein n=1 Tax=Streptomyces sp. CB02923 TaxID=1718985 RepID=UPI0009402F2A|nr:hypothetical protein [Streptomyces sp. CB02923]OKI09421.1 hypothetical protein A6A06_01570 [Streptomyces sp. CB02923]